MVILLPDETPLAINWLATVWVVPAVKVTVRAEVLVKFRLKKAVEPAIVCVLVLSNQTVPPFASKVPLVLVKFPAKVMVPEGAVKAPEERVKLPSKLDRK